MMAAKIRFLNLALGQGMVNLNCSLEVRKMDMGMNFLRFTKFFKLRKSLQQQNLCNQDNLFKSVIQKMSPEELQMQY